MSGNGRRHRLNGDLTVPGGTTLTAKGFDGNGGGVLAMRVSGTLRVDGTISMSQRGYRGGTGGSNAGPETHTGRRATGGGTGGLVGQHAIAAMVVIPLQV